MHLSEPLLISRTVKVTSYASIFFGGFYLCAIKKVCNYTQGIKKVELPQVPSC
jgi:hypothetical protein